MRSRSREPIKAPHCNDLELSTPGIGHEAVKGWPPILGTRHYIAVDRVCGQTPATPLAELWQLARLQVGVLFAGRNPRVDRRPFCLHGTSARVSQVKTCETAKHSKSRQRNQRVSARVSIDICATAIAAYFFAAFAFFHLARAAFFALLVFAAAVM